MPRPVLFSRNTSTDQLKGMLQPHPTKRVLINFGSRSEALSNYIQTHPQAVVVNHPRYISNSSDKRNFANIVSQFIKDLSVEDIPNEVLEHMNEVRTISFADYITERGNVQWSKFISNINFPVVVKLRKGKGGEGMLKFDTLEALREWRDGQPTENLYSYILQEVVQPDFARNYEFRVGVIPNLANISVRFSEQNSNNYGIVSLRRKFLTAEAISQGVFGRNLRDGVAFFRVLPIEENQTSLRLNSRVSIDLSVLAGICNSIVSICNLQFAAVDIIYDSATQKFSVLEINTAPSMGEDGSLVAQEWAAGLNTLISTIL